MEATVGENGEASRGKAKARDANAADAAEKISEAGRQEINDLVADIQDLLGRLSHFTDPEMARLRMKVERGLTAAKRTLADGTDQVQRHARNAIGAGDSYVRNQPWQAVGIAAFAGLVVGFLAARR